MKRTNHISFVTNCLNGKNANNKGSGLFIIRQTSKVFACLALLVSVCCVNAFGEEVAPGAAGYTVPAPVFQTGNTLSQPYADDADEAKDFIRFFNQTYLKKSAQIPLLDKQQVVWFPPQAFGDTSFEAVHRAPAKKSTQCNDPSGYPIVCEQDFSTGEFCQACHDSALYNGGDLPEMAYYSEAGHQQWLANWSQYGDWSASIMRLATRDPIWQAQIETETNNNPFVDPAVIQDVCFSCHGAMGERQLQADLKMDFSTDIFYATIPGILPTENRGKAYPFTGDCIPIPGKSVAQNQDLYAKYGSLARDGVSCEVCHRLGPIPDASGKGSGQWNGTDFSVFYGQKHLNNVQLRQTENHYPLEYDFTANFKYDMTSILTPDPVAQLDAKPMEDKDYLNIAYAHNLKDNVSFLKQSVMCGSCHLLIVPQIPTAFKPDGPLPDSKTYPFYKKPEACTANTFAPPTKGKLGNPVTDNCVALGYEQATYLEWINSDFASEKDNENTCQGCHMPHVTDPNNGNNHTAIMAQAVDGLVPKNYRRHRLMGINLPVFDMFMQFPDVLGVDLADNRVPPSGPGPNGKPVDFIQTNLLNGQMAIVEQATSQANGNGLLPNSTTPDQQAAVELSITSLNQSATTLQADLMVVNNTGHKFPSGAGFRRAFIKFEVLDKAGKVLWISGDTNPYGAICDGACKNQGNGSYHLLQSEVPDGDPKKLQPHYAVVSRQDQVQIYEVQAVDDTGRLTSRTLSLFFDAKDNRLLPRGWTSEDTLGCQQNKNAGRVTFGISQCSAAGGTSPQLNPLTVNSAIANDPHYSDPLKTGSDTISYQIPLKDIKGQADSIRVTMQYQTIPPNFLASRFKDGYDKTKKAYLPATERSIYLTSHLNTNSSLKSEHPDNPDLSFSKNWTISIHQQTAKLSAAKSEPVVCSVFENGYQNISGLSDALYVNSPYQVCVPDGSAKGSCRKWFGRCQVQSSGEAVNFEVFNNDYSQPSAQRDAVYFKQPEQACIPDGSANGICRRWTGLPKTASGKAVECFLFNDGYSSLVGPTNAIFFKQNGEVCMPDNGGTCRKWFGRCQTVSE